MNSPTTCGQMMWGGCGNPDLGHSGPCTPWDDHDRGSAKFRALPDDERARLLAERDAARVTRIHAAPEPFEPHEYVPSNPALTVIGGSCALCGSPPFLGPHAPGYVPPDRSTSPLFDSKPMNPPDCVCRYKHCSDPGCRSTAPSQGAVKERDRSFPVIAQHRCNEDCWTYCSADRDGDCYSAKCPQIRDDEPLRSGRHCPLDRCFSERAVSRRPDHVSVNEYTAGGTA
jgi:hypothetical protein